MTKEEYKAKFKTICHLPTKTSTMHNALFIFTEASNDENYTAELRTLPSFGEVQIACKATLDYSYMVESIEKDENYKHKMKERAITDLINDFFERIMKESEHTKNTLIMPDKNKMQELIEATVKRVSMDYEISEIAFNSQLSRKELIDRLIVSDATVWVLKHQNEIIKITNNA